MRGVCGGQHVLYRSEIYDSLEDALEGVSEGGQLTVGGGQFTVGGGPRTVRGGQFTLGGGQFTAIRIKPYIKPYMRVYSHDGPTGLCTCGAVAVAVSRWTDESRMKRVFDNVPALVEAVVEAGLLIGPAAPMTKTTRTPVADNANNANKIDNIDDIGHAEE
eukprot:2977638-Pyramimonas_sp.AAC.1